MEGWAGDHVLRQGIAVLSSDHKRVGKLHEVVVDAGNDRLTRLIVNVGPYFPMPGFGAPTLLSVPPEEVEEVREDALFLRCSALVFEHFPQYADWIVGGVGKYHTGSATKNPHRNPTERDITEGRKSG